MGIPLRSDPSALGPRATGPAEIVAAYNDAARLMFAAARRAGRSDALRVAMHQHVAASSSHASLRGLEVAVDGSIDAGRLIEGARATSVDDDPLASSARLLCELLVLAAAEVDRLLPERERALVSEKIGIIAELAARSALPASQRPTAAAPPPAGLDLSADDLVEELPPIEPQRAGTTPSTRMAALPPPTPTSERLELPQPPSAPKLSRASISGTRSRIDSKPNIRPVAQPVASKAQPPVRPFAQTQIALAAPAAPPVAPAPTVAAPVAPVASFAEPIAPPIAPTPVPPAAFAPVPPAAFAPTPVPPAAFAPAPVVQRAEPPRSSVRRWLLLAAACTSAAVMAFALVMFVRDRRVPADAATAKAAAAEAKPIEHAAKKPVEEEPAAKAEQPEPAAQQEAPKPQPTQDHPSKPEAAKPQPSAEQTPKSQPAATEAPAKAASGSTGTIVTDPHADGHRVFVDGKLIGDAPQRLDVSCGDHSVRIGSKGALQTVHVECGSQVVVQLR